MCKPSTLTARASVTVADVSEQSSQETARLIEEKSGRALAVKCDVTRTEEVKAASSGAGVIGVKGGAA